MRSFTLLSTCAALIATAHAQIRFVEVTTVNLDVTSNVANPEFIGSNPAAVAWDGTHLWVAGYNNGLPGTETGLVEVANALTTPTVGTSFGRIASPNGRGYTGLDLAGGRLVAAYDNGMSDPLGYTAWNTATNTLTWSRAGRGSCGVAMDPGFGGQDSGVGYTAFGSGRRALYDAASGNDLYTLANGMVFSVTGVSTLWRDMDFDETSGDIYLRAANFLVKATRTGGNALTTPVVLFNALPNAEFVSGQNVAYLNRLGQDYVIFNNRPDGAPGQDFFNVITVVRPDGASVVVDWGTFAPALGSGYYSFSWHGPSETLALLDFSSRNVHIFSIDAPLGTVYCTANANSTGTTALTQANGSNVVVDNSLTLETTRLPLNAFAFYLTSRTQGFVQNPGGSAGNLCLSGAIGRYVGPGQIKNSGATGNVSLLTNLNSVPQPTGSVAVQAGETWNFQCWYRDVVGPNATSNFSNGLAVTFQ